MNDFAAFASDVICGLLGTWMAVGLIAVAVQQLRRIVGGVR